MEADLPSLDQIEVRVLGCLVEKELSTPDYYPLSLNALTNACNQKTNRDPVLVVEETDVVRGLDRLRRLGLAAQDAEGGRVPKYIHNLAGKLRLEPDEMAVVGELLLRGPQTVGELRSRAERMHAFADLAAVEQVLEELRLREPPLVTQLPRQPGHKESRFAHLLSAAPDPGGESLAPSPEAATVRVRAVDERIERLETEAAALRAELEELKQVFAAFRAQFE